MNPTTRSCRTVLGLKCYQGHYCHICEQSKELYNDLELNTTPFQAQSQIL
jgi:hypothetical protein